MSHEAMGLQPARSRTIEAMLKLEVPVSRRSETGQAGFPPITKARSSAPPARPGGLDNVDGDLDRADIAKALRIHKL